MGVELDLARKAVRSFSGIIKNNEESTRKVLAHTSKAITEHVDLAVFRYIRQIVIRS